MHSWWVRAIAVLAVCIAALLIIRLHGASGATPSPSAREAAAHGHALAEAWCSACHVVDKFAIAIGQRAPAFVAVAAQPSTTALSIRVFLQTSHEPMPNFILKKQDIDDIAAYILSLRLD
jgi:cytochrome c